MEKEHNSVPGLGRSAIAGSLGGFSIAFVSECGIVPPSHLSRIEEVVLGAIMIAGMWALPYAYCESVPLSDKIRNVMMAGGAGLLTGTLYYNGPQLLDVIKNYF